MSYIKLDERNLKFIKVRQEFNCEHLQGLEEVLIDELHHLSPQFKAGMKIGLAIGSRGISDLLPIVHTTISFLHDMGVKPFVLPAMGSHGGATSEGQQKILEGYGISENELGIPVRATMDVVNLSDNPSFPVYMDKIAWESDGVILINRIKPHTDFHGPYESGLYKMAVVGLGNHKQAMLFHSLSLNVLKERLPEVARKILHSGKIVGGIAILENACEKTMQVHVLDAEEIIKKEPGLLNIARRNQPALPLKEMDILLVDEIGKDISGIGMDPNIIGRLRIAGEEEPEFPRIRSIIACGLSKGSHGNALGMGLADVITRKLYEQADLEVMYKNVFTSTLLERAKIPVIAENIKEALEFAFRNNGEVPTGRETIIRIKNTMQLNEFWASIPAFEMMKNKSGIMPLSDPCSMIQENELIPF